MQYLNSEDASLISTAIAMEGQFAANDYTGSNIGPALRVLPGDVPIILSSPHAVKHPRDGQLKRADTFTGPLALQLAELSRTSALVYARTSDEDPNYDVDGPYKQQLIRLIQSTSARFVLDIHGLGQWRSEEIALGTARGQTLGSQQEILSVLLHELTKAQFTNLLVDDPIRFSASRPTTITSFVWRELGIPALQLEVHKKYRSANYAPDDYLKLLYTLRDAINVIQQVLEKNA